MQLPPVRLIAVLPVSGIVQWGAVCMLGGAGGVLSEAGAMVGVMQCSFHQ